MRLRPVWVFRCWVAMGLWALLLARLQAAWEAPLVLTQVPRRSSLRAACPSDRWQRRDAFFHEARLVLLTTNREEHLLSAGFAAACDPSLSFDGERLLFAAKQTREGGWRIWEMQLNGQRLRPVSPEGIEGRSPIYVSTLFTLDSPEPWFTTVFVGRPVAKGGEGGRASLFSLKLDGSELRRLTFNPGHSFDPRQMGDGKVLYSTEGGVGLRRDALAHVGLFAVHIEGADVELFGGERGGKCQQMACSTENGLVVFVEPDEGAADDAGRLACVEERRPHVTYRRLQNDAAVAFLYPASLKGPMLLVSRRPSDLSASAGLYSMDLDGGECELVYDNPEFDDLQACVIRRRTPPDGHSTVVSTKAETGVFYGLNCYTSDPAHELHLPVGSIRRVRVLEGLTQPGANDRSADKERRGASVPCRLVGEAPVEADGSFNVEVPADTPLLFQTVDEHGLALGTCGWVWVKGKETRGCIGCHEDPERIPENQYVLALRRPSNRLILPPAQRRLVTFHEVIAPILQKHCAAVECHGGKETPLHLPLAAEMPSRSDRAAAYAVLLGGASASAEVAGRPRYVDPGRARTSWLVWQLLGRNTAHAGDPPPAWTDDGREKIRQMPPAGKATPLTEEELRTIIQWIDMGAPAEMPGVTVGAEAKKEL